IASDGAGTASALSNGLSTSNQGLLNDTFIVFPLCDDWTRANNGRPGLQRLSCLNGNATLSESDPLRLRDQSECK
uniref:Uncharacterized protein n=1 Tax=Anopheles atroparvus TaxID=41427 RepID=A0AAG5CRZ0_ANOAO